MKRFNIHKQPLEKNFLGVHMPTLGKAVGELNGGALKLYLYLSCNKDEYGWNLNNKAFANWSGVQFTGDEKKDADIMRSVNKGIQRGIDELEAKGYIIKEKDGTYSFYELAKKEQIVPKELDSKKGTKSSVEEAEKGQNVPKSDQETKCSVESLFKPNLQFGTFNF